MSDSIGEFNRQVLAIQKYAYSLPKLEAGEYF
jgi:hypothetical protein